MIVLTLIDLFAAQPTASQLKETFRTRDTGSRPVLMFNSF
jgi:hypothetical protein